MKGPVVALIDHGSEINLMWSEFYAQGMWPIDKNHGWKIRVAIGTTKDLFRACPNVKVTIGDVLVDQNNFLCARTINLPCHPFSTIHYHSKDGNKRD